MDLPKRDYKKSWMSQWIDLAGALEGLALPGEHIAEMLLDASYRLPDEGTASMLLSASYRLPNEEVASWLAGASHRFPDEGVASMLLRASERMPDEPYLYQLDNRIQSLEDAADKIRTAAIEASKVTIRVRPPQHTNSPWRWFAGGVITAAVVLLVGVAIGIWMANR